MPGWVASFAPIALIPLSWDNVAMLHVGMFVVGPFWPKFQVTKFAIDVANFVVVLPKDRLGREVLVALFARDPEARDDGWMEAFDMRVKTPNVFNFCRTERTLFCFSGDGLEFLIGLYFGVTKGNVAFEFGPEMRSTLLQ